MESFEPKKLALIRVLQILQKHSDSGITLVCTETNRTCSKPAILQF